MNGNSSSNRWMWVVLGRVASYAILGAVATALVGALLIAASGALVGAILDASGSSPGVGVLMAFWGAAVGAVYGAKAGGVAGGILFGIVGFRSSARRSFLPPKSLLFPVIIGMSAATLGIMTSFFAGCAGFALARGGAFASFVTEGLIFIVFAAPAVMVCGEIAGAIWGFRREKAALDA